MGLFSRFRRKRPAPPLARPPTPPRHKSPSPKSKTRSPSKQKTPSPSRTRSLKRTIHAEPLVPSFKPLPIQPQIPAAAPVPVPKKVRRLQLSPSSLQAPMQPPITQRQAALLALQKKANLPAEWNVKGEGVLTQDEYRRLLQKTRKVKKNNGFDLKKYNEKMKAIAKLNKDREYHCKQSRDFNDVWYKEEIYRIYLDDLLEAKKAGVF